MKPKHKEHYFLFTFFIIFLIGFVLGAYFSTEVAKSQSNFREEYIEKCYYENGVYQDLCGHFETLTEDLDLQECINMCYSK